MLNSNDFSSLQSAINAAAGGKLMIAHGTYTTTGLTIPSNIQIDTDGPVIIQSTTNSPIFDCSNSVNFIIRGHITLIGNGPTYTGYGCTMSDAGQIGIKLNSSDRYEISGKIEIENIAGTGVLRQLSAGNWQHQGHLSGICVTSCYRGFYGTNYAEYETISDCSADNCVYGIYEESGNNTYINCKTRYNSIGVKLYGGLNDAHGVFCGLESNHNTYNLTIVNIDIGETFTGCNFISEQSGSGHGLIQIINSKGINIVGGQIGSDISVDATSTLSVQNNYIRTTLASLPTVATGGLLISKNNFIDTGLWSGNN